jgi:hypothetical protein
MTSATLNRARLDPVSDEALIEARDEYIESESAKLINADLFGLFADISGGGHEMLTTLYSGAPKDLLELQQGFRLRMQHEARLRSMARWSASEAARAVLRIQDGRVS